MVPQDVRTRGARIRFVEAGEGAALLLVHDALVHHEVFGACLSHLATRFRVIAPDLPGFGASEKPDPQKYAYGYDAFSESIFDLIAALGLGRVHLLGLGMGAGIALTLAAKHPAVVEKLVLVSASVFPCDEHPVERAARLPFAGGLLWRQVMGRSMFESVVAGSVFASSAPTASAGRARSVDFYGAFNAPAARQAAHATMVAKSDSRSIVAKLPRIIAETLVIWGRDDAAAPVEHGRRLARELRGRFDVLECGRCPPMEEPEAFSAATLSFLEPPVSRRPSRLPH